MQLSTNVQTSGPLFDERLTAVRSTSSPSTLRSYPTKRVWQARAAQIREHILVTTGLWPLSERAPLQARIFERTEREGYSIEKVYFESLPGFLVCGNLYRPNGKGRFAGMLCPHGHWKRGRLEHTKVGSVPARCINFAKLGFVVFSYDMVGYNDSDQIPHRDLFGSRETIWGIGTLGLQLWNSIRAVDFLCSLADVDSRRLGCTGASGGGSQTFLLAAVDDRVTAAAPAVMVAADFQGGCHCENQGHLRLDINNVEIAATMAPKPLMLVAASGDWTENTMELEYPAIRDIYGLYGAKDRISATIVNAPHNFNHTSREAVYTFFSKWLLGKRGRIREQRFTVEPDENLLVFSRRAKPKGLLGRRKLVESLVRRAKQNRATLSANRPSTLRSFKAWAQTSLRHALGVSYPSQPDVFVKEMGRERRMTFIARRKLLGRKEQGERIPALLFEPLERHQRMSAVMVVHSKGKAALVDTRAGRPKKEVADLLHRGFTVLTIDPFSIGESVLTPATKKSPLYTTTYNQTCAARRVQDIVTSLSWLQQQRHIRSVALIGLDDAGLWCLMARAFCPKPVRTAVNLNRFDVDDDRCWQSKFLVPAVRSAGDVRSAVALTAPSPLLIHNTGPSFPTRWARTAYRAAGHPDHLQLNQRRLSWVTVRDWIVDK